MEPAAAEEAVLGAALLCAESLPAILHAGLVAEDFGRERQRVAVAAIAESHAAGERPDVLTVVRRLEQRGELELAGGRGAIDGWAPPSPEACASCLLLEGSDQDTADRVKALIPDDALDRILILDRWSSDVGDGLLESTAGAIRSHRADVVLIDTLPALLEDRYDTRYGLPEAAGSDLERLRRQSRRDVALIGVMHTRKADRANKAVDEVEEIGGAIAKKADAAIVIRADGEDGPRRRVRFVKVRTGPKPPGKIATFPTDPAAPPILELIGDLGGRPVTAGTEAEGHSRVDHHAARTRPSRGPTCAVRGLGNHAA